ncbi:phage tail tape measure protein [Methylobacterium brachiatum]|uniref:Phage tail tape measure protein n=1 Tax=Methylobacterium brachiatum TaxID=269660 RepID=A0ABV1R4T2_9HYPH
MPDDKINLEIGVDVKVTDLDQAKALREEFERLNREILQLSRDLKIAMNPMASLGRARSQLSGTAARGGSTALDAERQLYSDLKRRFAFERRMQAQQRKEESTAAKRLKEEQAETRRALNDQLNFSMRMMRERARAEAEAERTTRREIEATAKARDKANRKAISEAKDLERAQAKAAGRAARGAGQIRDGVGRVAGTAAATGAVVGYGAERFVGRGIASRMDTDTAETQLKIFGDTDDGRGGKRAITDEDIRKLRRGPDGLDNLAVRTGTSIPDALKGYTEAAKAGLIDPMGQTRNILSAGNGLELDPTKTTKLLGTLARNIGAGATPDRLKRTLNAIAVGAREDPTQSGEIVEGLNRAQGVLAMSKGITPEDLVAMVSGGQSVGIQPGKAGTFLPAFARSVLEGGKPRKFIDPKRLKELTFASKKLGFSSARDMANQFAGENGKAAYYQIMRGLQGMAPQLRQQVADALSGGQWADEDLQIVNGIDGQIRTDTEIHDPRNAGFLDEANAKKMQSWQGLWNQSKTIFSLFWESFGDGFDGILRDINAFVLDLHGKLNYDRISGYVREGLDGLKAGLGFDSWKQALQSLVPGNVGNLGKQIGGFARGFSSAIRELAGAVSSVAGLFGGNGSAESIGRLTAQFLALGAAAIVLAPVMGVLGGVASIVLGLVNVARAAAGVLGMGAGAAAGGLGGGAVAGALGAIARILSGGFIVGLAATIGSMRGEISAMVLSAVRPLVTAIWEGLKSAFSLEGLKSGGRAILNELIPAPLQRWLDSGSPDQGKAESGPKADGSHWVEPPTRDNTVPRKLTEAIQANTDALRARTKAATGTASSTGSGISFEDWQRQFAGIRGSQVGQQINHGLRGHIGRLRGGGGVPGAGGRAVSGPGNGTMPTSSTAGSLTELINAEAARAGIDPRIMQGIRAGESGHRADYDVKSDRKEDSYGPFQLNRRGGLGAVFERETGLDARDPKTILAQTRWVAELIKKRGRGVLQQWYGYHGDRDADPSWGNSGYVPNSPAGSGGSAVAAGGPVVRGEGGQSVPHLGGKIDVEGAKFDFGSGGHRGSNSIPFGTYPITPDAIGPWGRANGAIGINSNAIWDQSLGRMRTGIEFHAASNARMLTAGCIGVAREQWAGFKDRMLAVYRRAGRAFLTVGPNGASITADRPEDPSAKVAADAKRTQDLGAGLNKPKLGDLDLAPQAGLGSKAPLGASVPIRPTPSGSSGSGQGGNNAVHAPITVVSHGGDAEAIAGKVQRHLQDAMNRRTHDYDGFA